MKRCSLGKSCGATCIDAQERCVLEFGPEASSSLTKVRDFLNNRDVDWTDEQAAKWTKANLKTIDSFQIDNLEGGKGTMWIIGNEPGMGLDGARMSNTLVFQALRDKYPNLSDKQFSANWDKIVEDNPAVIARSQRQNFEEARVASKLVGERVMADALFLNPRMRDMVENQGLFPKGLGVKEELSKMGTEDGIAWIKPHTYWGKALKLAENVGAKKVYNTNVSWLGSPSESVWPWGKLFEKAKMDPGPFRTRASWLKHSVEVRGDLIKDRILKEKPENVYMSGKNGSSIFEKLARGSNPFQTTVKWVSPNGNERQATFMVAKLGDSRIVLGPHFTAQMPKSVIDMRARLMKGERPDNAVVVNTGPVMKQSAVKVAKVAAKELRREVKPEAAKKVDMATWSVTRLQNAYQRAYDRGDTGQMAQIQAVLNNK